MKLNVQEIAGFEEMTAEEKVKSLLDYEIKVPETDDKETARLKTALSNANSQAAEYKRLLREKQTEAERAEAERKEREAAVEEELRTLRRDKTVSGYIAQYLALGYNKELALKAAEATADNDAATIMSCQQEYLAEKTKELEAAALNKQPTITAGSPPTAQAAEADAYNKMRKAWGLPPIK